MIVPLAVPSLTTLALVHTLSSFAPDRHPGLTPHERRPGVAWRVAQAWEQLSPEDRARALQSYQRYQRLPESSRERVDRRYERFQGMPPAEQEQLRRNYDVYRNMTPSQRREFSERYQRWRGGGKD